MIRPKYIVIAAPDEAMHTQLVELLKPHIGERITYIDVRPTSKVLIDRNDQEYLWLKVER